MKNILVPTDFSQNARQASDYAAEMANLCGATLHLVHAYNLLENKSTESHSIRETFNTGQIESRKSKLTIQKEMIAEKYPGISTKNRLFTGPTEEVLTQYITNNDIDLVVMGTQGTSGIAVALLGSVTASLITASTIPILVIPANYTGSPTENIVLATRHFEQDRKVLDPVFEMAALYKVPVHLFAFESDNNSDLTIAENTLKLQQYLSFLQTTYPQATLKSMLYEGDDFEKSINDYCTRNNTGMICMLTHKRNFLGKVFNPSLTKKMASQTRVPLLAIPVNN